MMPEIIPTSLNALSGKLMEAGAAVVKVAADDDDDDDDDDAGGGGITAEEVAAHDKPGDVWIIVNNKVIDVSEFVKVHPGGEAAIMAFAGKDASVEWNMIHKPDFLDIHVKDKILGEIGKGGGGGGGGGAKKKKAVAAAPAGGGGGLTMEEVAKHNTKADCWVVVDNKVLDVTKFLKDHPGGELAILTFAGKDATKEFNMIHAPDVIKKYAPDALVGELGKAPAGAPASKAAAGGG